MNSATSAEATSSAPNESLAQTRTSSAVRPATIMAQMQAPTPSVLKYRPLSRLTMMTSPSIVSWTIEGPPTPRRLKASPSVRLPTYPDVNHAHEQCNRAEPRLNDEGGG